MKLLACIAIIIFPALCYAQSPVLVFQSDFGMKDGAVASMKGVAFSVSSELKMFDLTHEIPPYNIWEAAYRLRQSAAYWPAGTVFVSVVDPGVGSVRKSIVMKSRNGHFFVTPDNGTVTLVADAFGIEEVRIIDESHRLPGSDSSYTFHGRDVYAFTAARLASGQVRFSDLGGVLAEVVKIPYQPAKLEGDGITGTIDILDVQYGNVWTNIDAKTFAKLNIATGDQIEVKIYFKRTLKLATVLVFGNTFSAVPEGKSLAYLNSLMNLSFATNLGNFAARYGIESGPDWNVFIRKKAR